MNLGKVVEQTKDTINHTAEDRVAGRSGDNLLAELDLVVNICLGAAVKPVKLNANNKINLIAEFSGNSFIDRF